MEKMTLAEFISKMLAGWGFHRPSRVKYLGECLQNIIPKQDLDKIIQVEFIQSYSGSGPGFHYIYRWEISGYELKDLGKWWGWQKYVWENGNNKFTIGYIW